MDEDGELKRSPTLGCVLLTVGPPLLWPQAVEARVVFANSTVVPPRRRRPHPSLTPLVLQGDLPALLLLWEKEFFSAWGSPCKMMRDEIQR
jgi:hypothetical protein